MADGRVNETSGSNTLADPVLNGPYDPPSRYFELGRKGPTGIVREGRRTSESFIPVPQPKKKRTAKDAEDEQLEFTLRTDEQVQVNHLINNLRDHVMQWRNDNYAGATAISRRLLTHWADSERDNRILFAQREAAETAIFLAEVANRQSSARRWRHELERANDEYNDGLPRVALKMATGTGKTVVMAMLIAWQTLNKVASPSDRRFTKRFLIVTPGITIRDRLRVLQPNDSGNYYVLRGLIPADLAGLLAKAQIIITNWHTFQLKDTKEVKGVSTATRKILLDGRADDPFKETDDAMVSRVLRGWGVGTTGSTASGKARGGEIMVFNDEAHHCYQDRPITVEDESAGIEQPDREETTRNQDARIWFKGLQAIDRRVGIKQVYDLSATPFYLSGSGYKEGFIFPWTVSDFSLMDAIESGIVKVPRIPVDDDARSDGVTYLDLWDQVKRDLPKTNRRNLNITTWTPPAELEGALYSLYHSYEKSFEHWQKELAAFGEPPPVFIVVCPNTAVSKLVFDWIAGTELTSDDGQTLQVGGKLPLFANTSDGATLARPHSILVDSAQLESGEGLSKDFKAAASSEIEAFKAAWRIRNPGGDTESITDEDLLREVMNTVGKPDSLGSDVRCVVSVSMLTEGWDANTVTHILGIRAFGSQLLCEQVVGRGLRRRSYVTDDSGRFPAEYANVYGVPFAFIPTDVLLPEGKPPAPAINVTTVPGREACRITFPRLAGYRYELTDPQPYLDDTIEPFIIGPDTVPSWTEAAPIVGTPELIQDDVVDLRPRSVAYRLARRLIRREFSTGVELATNPLDDKSVGSPAREDQRPWLFPTLVDLCYQWIERAVVVEPGFHLGYLAKYAVWEAKAADAVFQSIIRQHDAGLVRIKPLLRPFDPVGSTAKISFITRKAAIPTDGDRCEISHVVLDGPDGNTWEQLAMAFCEHISSPVAAYVKNDHLGFTIPYTYQGVSHEYHPDFLVRLRRRTDEKVDRTLIVEVSGGQKRKHAPGPTKMKAEVARNSWCAAVNNHGGFGRWGFVEVTDPVTMNTVLNQAIENLYADQAIIGDPDVLDLAGIAARDERGSYAAAR